MLKTPLSIWLADPFHSRFSIGDIVPLNIGYLAAALKQSYGAEIHIELFKYPEPLIERLKSNPPDVLAISNYTWNERLSLFISRIAHTVSPRTYIVMGGPNIRLDSKAIADYLSCHPEIDIFVPLEGEVPFCELIKSLLEHGIVRPIDKFVEKTGSIKGCHFNVEDYEFSFTGKEEQKQALNFNSPYLSGFLDPFISDHRLYPIFETNRGCPYPCTFCMWGVSALNKLRQRDLDLVLEEFRYVASKSAAQDYWFFADANFGILERDIIFAQELRRISNEKGFPVRIDVNWAKNSSHRIKGIVDALGDMSPAQIAVQSFDSEVLKKIKRKNLADSEICELIGAYHDKGLTVATDLLVGSSGESLQSHYYSLRTCFELDYDILNISQIRLLAGSEMESDHDRNAYGLRTQYRLTPNCYGYYDGRFIFETEEAVIASNDMSEDELKSLKVPHFLIYLLWNSGFCRGLLRYSVTCGLNPLDVILKIAQGNEGLPFEILFRELERDYRNEWFTSQKEIHSHYADPKTLEALENGGEFLKLTWKYVARCMVEPGMIISLIDRSAQIINSHHNANREIVRVLVQISKDRLKLDMLSGESLEKTGVYSVSRADFLFLQSEGLLPDHMHYSREGFVIHYQYNKDDFDSFSNLLRKYRFSQNPLPAVCSAMSKGMIRYLTYSMKSGELARRERAGKPYTQGD